MFKLKFSRTYDNVVFTQYGLKPVVEDYFKQDENIFCVADGVTRDLIDGTTTPYPKNFEEVQKIVDLYPNPSGAFEAAKICGDGFVKYLSEYSKNDVNEKVIKDIVKKVNEDIWQINKNRNIDYLKDDLYCTVAVGGIILDDILYCFSIGDCHIMLFDDNLNNVFSTIDGLIDFNNFQKEFLSKNGLDWSNPIERILIRSSFRNNPLIKYNGMEVSYGVLSGEEDAMHYVNIYKVSLENVKYICAYSDGCEPFFETADKIKETINNPSSIGDIGKEKTLLIYEKI